MGEALTLFFEICQACAELIAVQCILIKFLSDFNPTSSKNVGNNLKRSRQLQVLVVYCSTLTAVNQDMMGNASLSPHLTVN